MNTDSKFYEAIHWLFEMTQQGETAPPLALGVKLSEEVGEFSEALLKQQGFLAHKELKERPIDEAADIFNVLIGCLAVMYPERTPYELTEELYDAICTKGEKYERILKQNIRT